MKLFKKIGQALGILKASEKQQKSSIEPKRSTGGSKWTPPTTNTPEKRKKKKLNRLSNKARNSQHSKTV